MIDTIILRFGYVESSRSSVMIMTTLDKQKFATPHLALKSLAEDLFAKYKAEHNSIVSSCCKKCKKNANFCSECGANIVNRDDLDDEGFSDFLCELQTSDCNSYGMSHLGEGYETPDHARWDVNEGLTNLFASKCKTAFVVGSGAEYVLAAFLPNFYDAEGQDRIFQIYCPELCSDGCDE